MPVTIPLVRPMVAIPGAELDHVPPAIESNNVVVWPMHTTFMPVIGASSNTLTAWVFLQPAGVSYVTIPVPTDIPDMTPVTGSIVTTPGVPPDHVPPGIELLSVVLVPMHIENVPDITGSGLNVTGTVKVSDTGTPPTIFVLITLYKPASLAVVGNLTVFCVVLNTSVEGAGPYHW
jgi:hypothetical protein